MDELVAAGAVPVSFGGDFDGVGAGAGTDCPRGIWALRGQKGLKRESHSVSTLDGLVAAGVVLLSFGCHFDRAGAGARRGTARGI